MGGLYAGMAEQFLQHPQVGTARVHVGGFVAGIGELVTGTG